MDSFHLIVLVVASASLIVVLTIAGILLSKDKRSQKFPTSHSEKPDDWTLTRDASGGYVTLTSDDDSAGAEKKFSTAEWADICVKKKWADQNNVYWDGITTYNGC